MKNTNQLQTSLIFITLLLIVSWLYNYPKILFYPPYSLHAWRQADCLSFALNYFKDNLNFFNPEINGLGDSGNGKTVSEFPIIYYIVAKLWKIFGQKEFIFRIIDVSIVFFGLFNLHRLCRLILKDTFFSIAIPLFLFTSPVLVYYTNNFLADAPAFGLALSGCYYLYRYISMSESKAIWYSIILFLLGGLIKISSLLIFFSITGALTIELLLNYKQIDKLKLKTLLIGFSIIMLSIGCWYIYARYYNSKNNSGFFLQSIFPIWELSGEERKFIFDRLYFTLMPSFFNRIAFATVLIFFISIIIFHKKIQRYLLLVCIFCFIGFVAYFFLWFKAFDVHDYYLTNLLIFIPLVLLTFFEFLNLNYSKIFNNTGLKVVLSLILVFLTYQTALKNRLKYDSRKYFASNLILNKGEREFGEYYHWSYANNFKAFETIKPYLRSLGILRTDKVICFADESINISLYLMDQKGYTKYGYSRFSDKERIEFAISKGCKYLILSNEQVNKLEGIETYMMHKIGQYQNISIYSLDRGQL
jgi:hypothetical protein